MSPFSPSNVDIIDSYFYMSFLNIYYITLCKLLLKKLIINEVKNWQVCYLGMVTLVMAHYIANLPFTWQVFWCLYNTTKIPFIFISIEIFSHFCDVFIQYYKILILHFYYLYQKLPKELWRMVILRHSSKPTPYIIN